MKLRKLSALLAALAMMFVTGCATQSFDPATAPEYMIISSFAPFYRLGPQQASGPDVSLRQGTRIKLLRKEMGYSYVQLDDGRAGYIANESMAPAPPRPKETPAGLPATGPGSSKKPGAKGRGDVGPVYSGPQMNDTPLPDPNVPPPDLNIDPEVVPSTIPVPSETPSGTPKFRY